MVFAFKPKYFSKFLSIGKKISEILASVSSSSTSSYFPAKLKPYYNKYVKQTNKHCVDHIAHLNKESNF